MQSGLAGRPGRATPWNRGRDAPISRRTTRAFFFRAKNERGSPSKTVRDDRRRRRRAPKLAEERRCHRRPLAKRQARDLVAGHEPAALRGRSGAAARNRHLGRDRRRRRCADCPSLVTVQARAPASPDAEPVPARVPVAEPSASAAGPLRRASAQQAWALEASAQRAQAPQLLSPCVAQPCASVPPSTLPSLWPWSWPCGHPPSWPSPCAQRRASSFSPAPSSPSSWSSSSSTSTSSP